MIIFEGVNLAGTTTSLLSLAIGFGKGAGAIFGLIGTVVYPAILMLSGGSLERAGVWTVWGIFLTLLPVGILFAIRRYFDGDGGGMTSEVSVAWVMIITVVVARLWLWAFDLDHTQIMQERIAKDVRGAVNGCQTALYQVRFFLSLSSSSYD